MTHFKSFYSCIIIFATMMLISCNNDNSFILSNGDEISIQSEEFGRFHNEALESILSNLKSTRSNDSVISINSLKTRSINHTTSTVLMKDSSLEYIPTKETIRTTSLLSVSEIEQISSRNERRIMSNLKHYIKIGWDIDQLKQYADAIANNDNNIKMAAYNFIDTYFSSCSYWEGNKDEWINYINDNVIESKSSSNSRWYERVAWDQVMFSDAYYAWYGTVSSGGNLYVGAGAAAVGSLFTVLNCL